MKKVLGISICMLALMTFAVCIPEVAAFNFYSNLNYGGNSGTGGCATCHTAFRANPNYLSPAEGVNWGDSLHNVHLNNTDIGSNCDHCHFGIDTGGRGVNLGSSASGPGGSMAIACTGCHVPEGLRAHHAASGVTLCAGCHPGDSLPAAENIAPPWYGSVININTGTNLEPCNISGEEQLAGLSIGLDNDGDLLYDAADPDCLCSVDADCDNGQFCDGVETCDTATGACIPGTPIDCSDGVNCTIDSCDESSNSCVHLPDDASCPDDGLFCTGNELCDPFVGCVSAGDPCPMGTVCNEGTDTCDAVCTSDADCDNGQFCDGVETCNLITGECMPGLICPIAIDGCVVLGGDCDEINDLCVDVPDDSLCDDGLFCNGTETCDVTTRSCMPGSDPCPSGSTCNEGSDECDIADQKVTICHIPPGNPGNAKTKSIDSTSVADHLAHGDLLGPCPGM